MYSIHPYNYANIELDLPITMYSIRPVIQEIKQSSLSVTNDSLLNDIEQRQDILIEKFKHLFKKD